MYLRPVRMNFVFIRWSNKSVFNIFSCDGFPIWIWIWICWLPSLKWNIRTFSAFKYNRGLNLILAYPYLLTLALIVKPHGHFLWHEPLGGGAFWTLHHLISIILISDRPICNLRVGIQILILNMSSKLISDSYYYHDNHLYGYTPL